MAQKHVLFILFPVLLSIAKCQSLCNTYLTTTSNAVILQPFFEIVLGTLLEVRVKSIISIVFPKMMVYGASGYDRM